MDDVTQVEVTQEDVRLSDRIASEGPRLLRGIYRVELTQLIARHRIAAEAATEAKQADLIAALRDVLEDTRDVLDDAAHRVVADPYIVVELRALCERAGYGNVMSSASELWRSRLGEQAGGEFVAGPCRKTVQNAIARIDTAQKDAT